MRAISACLIIGTASVLATGCAYRHTGSKPLVPPPTAAVSSAPIPYFTLPIGRYIAEWDPKAEPAACNERSGGLFDSVGVYRGLSFRGGVSANARWTTRGRYGVLVDESAGSGKGYDVAYVFVDPPRAGILRIENAFRAPLRKTQNGLETDPFVLQVPFGARGARIVRPLSVSLVVDCSSEESRSQDSAPRGLLMDMKGGWRATIDIPGFGPVYMQPRDENGNGVFDDAPSSITKQGDKLIVMDKYAEPRLGSAEHLVEMNQGTASLLFDKLYTVKISPDGQTIDIGNYTGPKGWINFKPIDGYGRQTGWRMAELCNSKVSLTLRQHYGNRFQVPVGEYAYNLELLPVCYKGKSPNGSEVREVTFHLDGVPEGATQVAIRKDKDTEFVTGGQLAIDVLRGGSEDIPEGPIRVSLQGCELVTGLRSSTFRVRGYGCSGNPSGGNSGLGLWCTAVAVKDESGTIVKSITTSDVPGEAKLVIDNSWKPGKYSMQIKTSLGPYQKDVSVTRTLIVE